MSWSGDWARLQTAWRLAAQGFDSSFGAAESEIPRKRQVDSLLQKTLKRETSFTSIKVCNATFRTGCCHTQAVIIVKTTVCNKYIYVEEVQFNIVEST